MKKQKACGFDFGCVSKAQKRRNPCSYSCPYFCEMDKMCRLTDDFNCEPKRDRRALLSEKAKSLTRILASRSLDEEQDESEKCVYGVTNRAGVNPGCATPCASGCCFCSFCNPSYCLPASICKSLLPDSLEDVQMCAKQINETDCPIG